MKNIQLYIGEEPYGIKIRINRNIENSGVDEFNITTYDLEVDSLDSAIEDAMTIPFMSEEKIVILKNPIFLILFILSFLLIMILLYHVLTKK